MTQILVPVKCETCIVGQWVGNTHSAEERIGFESRFMRGCFSFPEVVEEEVPDFRKLQQMK